MFLEFISVIFYLFADWCSYMAVFVTAAGCFGWDFNFGAATFLALAIELWRSLHRKESKK